MYRTVKLDCFPYMFVISFIIIVLCSNNIQLPKYNVELIKWCLYQKKNFPWSKTLPSPPVCLHTDTLKSKQTKHEYHTRIGHFENMLFCVYSIWLRHYSVKIKIFYIWPIFWIRFKLRQTAGTERCRSVYKKLEWGWGAFQTQNKYNSLLIKAKK